MPVEIEKDPEEQVGGFLTFTYPKLPENVDFETFRKTDEDWKKLTKWYNKDREPRAHLERFLLLQWPRNPDGPPMKTTPRGKDTGNGCELWGATLYDFYRVHRIPSCPSISTITTGSKLAAWMKEIGELEWAENQLKQAELEDEPHEIHPFDIGQYIEVLEEQVWKGEVGKPMDIDRTDRKVGKLVLEAPALYPAPWPLRPFSVPLARFQKKLPISFLPRKLIVHDPWNTLLVDEHPSGHRQNRRGSMYEDSDDDMPQDNKEDYRWGSRPDITYTYNLHLSEDGEKRQNPQHIGERPEGYKICPLAHLYISPKRRIGTGHHSFVYQVELELPRDMLVQPKICFECAVGKWTDHQVQEENGTAEPLDPKIDLSYQKYYSLMFKDNEPFEENDRLDMRFKVLRYMKWQSRPPFCEHLDRGVRAPPSQKVSVTAKLSLPDGTHSEHLRQEAYNYMAFPNHMSKHMNGYNVLQPMHHPTPVGAVVPQFYGFYGPDRSNEPVVQGKYMSSILLLEHCGVQIDPEKLCKDDRYECFSLLRRLHAAGYLHNSVYQRNILMQYGPLQMSPFQRSKKHLRFRLIDFGRTAKTNPGNEFQETSREYAEANTNLKLEFY
ncbi:hypothetical protein M0805_003183 [Coniferiporia weirii]|nr:hypothetical protein M0805_003183 [Coniferiporia weirii]